MGRPRRVPVRRWNMVRAGLGYLAAADAAQLSAATQAECLRAGAGRVGPDGGAGLDAGRVHRGAGVCRRRGRLRARSRLIHQTHTTSGAAVGHTAWAKRAADPTRGCWPRWPPSRSPSRWRG